MADRQEDPPVLGEHGEPCQQCGAPLAADQRYCLNCGTPRTGSRVDYRRLMSAASAGPAPAEPALAAAAAAPLEPRQSERDYAPLAAVGGIAVLGLMLLVGVLIGRGNTTPASAPAPVVRVGGASGSAGTADTSGSGKKPSSQAKNAKGSGKTDTGAKAVAGGLTGDAAKSSKATVQASTEDLNNLSSQSGSSYEESIKKLPDKIATPGAPPPIDTSKAPGGGGSAETIK
jgi:hypothetical protein